MPRQVCSAATTRSEVCPADQISASIGTRSVANAAAFADTGIRSATSPFSARRTFCPPDGSPDFTPLAFATATASLVRREVAYRSAWATRAMIPTVRSFSTGMSTATNRTPLSRRASKNAAFRDGRSSFAMTSVAPVTLARCSALANSGRSDPRRGSGDLHGPCRRGRTGRGL